MSDINHESPSVHSYLQILQSVINRMASNSAGCKTWCITLVSAIVVIIADKGKPDYVWVSLIPIVLFFFLDSYYLGMERGFREKYDEFIQKLHSDSATISDIFIVTPAGNVGNVLLSTIKSSLSLSVWPFYTLLAGMLCVVRVWVL